MWILNRNDWKTWQEWRENNTDFYGLGVIEYAERWADLMESRMKDGQQLEDIADQASHDADTEGITGFMYGAAVSVLCSCWAYGERLRRWHNLKTQLRDEGFHANEKANAVLNPAIVCIGEKA